MLAKRCLLAIFVSVACSANTYAQYTLGEALDKGAVKITQAEWVAMLPQHDWGSARIRDSDTAVTYYPDGKLAGTTNHNARGPLSMTLSGTWKMDETGQLCVDQVIKLTGVIHGAYSGCVFMFKAGENIFQVDAQSDLGRSAKVEKRTIKK